MQSKKYVLERLIKLNKDDEVSENDRFIRLKLKKDENLKIPQKYTCPEGLDISPNTMTLRHLYNSNGEFVVTVIARK